MTKKPLIISTDPGIDDIAAITLSLFAPELDVKMIVPTWGNVALKYTLKNALELETFLKTKIPVVRGANQPLLRKVISAAEVHGKTGVAGFTFPEADSSLLEAGLAATKMHEVISHSSEPVTLLGIGPLTDYALLFKQYPEDKKNIDQIVIMGGNIGQGNFGPFSEFNVAGDPEAAQIVFQSGLPIKVAPMEIGDQAHLTPEQMNKIKACGQVGEMLYQLFSNIHELDGDPKIKIYDPTAVGILLHPEFFDLRPANVEIELAGRYTYGASVMNFGHYLERPVSENDFNAEIAVSVDTNKFAEWFVAGVKKADQGRK